RRYETPSAFAADVQRYLNDEPVHACPPSRWYRFSKFARRHKAGLTTAASMVLAVLLAVGSLVAGNGQIKEERKETQAALEREQKITDDLSRASYRQSIQLADRELSANNLGRVEELLADCPEPLAFREHKHLGPIIAVAFSPDGKRFATSSWDKKA